MKKILPALSLLIAPIAMFSQARLVINGTSAVTIVESGGIVTKPIYIEINNPAANAITTIGSNGWIVSESEFNMVKWDVGLSSASTYVVPFGYGTAYSLPLTVQVGAAGVGAGGNIKFSTYHTPNLNSSLEPSDVHNMAPVNPSLSQPSPTDDSYQVVDRFWIIDAYSYTTKPQVNDIKFSYISSAGTPSEVGGLNVFPEANLFAQRWNPAMGWGDWFGPGGQDVPGGAVGTDHSFAFTGANFFRSWTLSNSNSPLPITISSFTDQCDNGLALVQWTSQTELNNDYYTVKKSTDNIHFETVGTVSTKAPGGTSDFALNYSITDNDPFAGTSYYYLYQTDIDGTIRSVGNPIQFNGCETPSTPAVNAYNTTNYIMVQINALSAGNYDISLMNMLGQTVIHENHSVSLGSNEIHLNNTISAGIYILNAKNGQVNYTKKLIVGVR